MTERTGGAVYYPPTLETIESAAIEIARQIRQQYTLGYEPLNQTLDGRYRAIRVKVASKDAIKVRTRAGY